MLSNKAAMLEESVIREMTRLSEINGAINLSQGMPDDPVPSPMKDALYRALKEGDDQYSFTWGKAELREKISRWMERRYGLSYDPTDELTVTCGVSEGLVGAIGALVNRGESVLLPEPLYENYLPGVIMAGARPYFLPPSEMGPQTGLHFDTDRLKEAFESGIRMIVLNSPHNPTGWVMDREFMGTVRDLAVDHDTLALTDEIYSEMLYDGRKHVSLASLDGMHERTVVLNGASKTFGATGWRVGWACAPRELSAGIRRYHDYMTICAPTPMQSAVVAGLGMEDSYYDGLVRTYTRRRDSFVPGLERLGLGCMKPQGAYYVFASFDTLAPSSWDDWQFARHLVSDRGVATVPGTSFFSDTGGERGGKRWLRFTFSRSDDLLEEALVRLERRLGALPTAKD